MTKPAGRRITKREFYDRGGFKNSRLYRKTDSLGRWRHFIIDGDDE